MIVEQRDLDDFKFMTAGQESIDTLNLQVEETQAANELTEESIVITEGEMYD